MLKAEVESNKLREKNSETIRVLHYFILNRVLLER